MTGRVAARGRASVPCSISGKKINDFNSVMTVLARLHRIAEILRSGKWVTAKKLAEEEECSTKTIYRTMDFLEFTLGWELVRGQGFTQGFRLIKEGNAPLCKSNAEVSHDDRA